MSQTGQTGQGQPSQLPPGAATAAGGTGGGASRPDELTEAQLATLARTGAGMDAAPTLAPPSELAGAGGGVTAWQSDKRINALWSISENRNSWVSVVGVGWKKLANNSDSAIVALTLLGAHAKQMQTAVNYRDEADGMIHEMYVW